MPPIPLETWDRTLNRAPHAPTHPPHPHALADVTDPTQSMGNPIKSISKSMGNNESIPSISPIDGEPLPDHRHQSGLHIGNTIGTSRHNNRPIVSLFLCPPPPPVTPVPGPRPPPSRDPRDPVPCPRPAPPRWPPSRAPRAPSRPVAACGGGGCVGAFCLL